MAKRRDALGQQRRARIALQCFRMVHGHVCVDVTVFGKLEDQGRAAGQRDPARIACMNRTVFQRRCGLRLHSADPAAGRGYWVGAGVQDVADAVANQVEGALEVR
ncbi:MAG TPA: hypothetical protein VKV73_25670 [Chloroflexota bacterium]|nr:hypothetical protein [Chloroflexota bacterium]